jgi:hypothetical protein
MRAARYAERLLVGVRRAQIVRQVGWHVRLRRGTDTPDAPSVSPRRAVEGVLIPTHPCERTIRRANAEPYAPG